MAATPRRKPRQEPALVIPLAEERLKASKRAETKTVRITKTVRERPAKIDQDLFSEEVVIERVPVDRVVDGPVPDRLEGDTLIVSLVEEVPAVIFRLKEELRITRKRVGRRDSRTVLLRSEEVRVERNPGAREEKR
jgi:stress response protein YsnF